MHLEIRPVARLRGSSPVSLQGTLEPLVAAVCGTDGLDLARLRVIYDWIQYRNNFREPVTCRPVLRSAGPPRRLNGTAEAAATPAPEPPDGLEEDGLELAVDLRRCPDLDLATCVKEGLADRERPGARVPLESWVPGSHSLIWQFNALYWQHLSIWEQATGREYEQALPGGESDARNIAAARTLVKELFGVWDRLRERGALPEELYVVELGVGNGNQARTWLDVFAAADREHGGDYYRRLHYLMGDYSPHVLQRARQAVADHGEHVSALVLDATRPAVTLGFLRDKAFLVYISNVYDNLPTDELASIRGRTYQVQVRAYLPEADAARIARRLNTPVEELPGLVGKLLRLGPELLTESAPQHLGGVDVAVTFWREVWAALRLEERYAPLEGLDLYEVAPSLTGEVLRPLLQVDGDIRMHVSNGALSSLAETLPLLHPFGRVVCHDLFVTDQRQYQSGFFGPGKYDGSVVNWVNGPLLQLLGNRRGFDVQFAPFQQRPGANIRTLTAQVRD